MKVITDVMWSSLTAIILTNLLEMWCIYQSACVLIGCQWAIRAEVPAHNRTSEAEQQAKFVQCQPFNVDGWACCPCTCNAHNRTEKSEKNPKRCDRFIETITSTNVLFGKQFFDIRELAQYRGLIIGALSTEKMIYEMTMSLNTASGRWIMGDTVLILEPHPSFTQLLSFCDEVPPREQVFLPVSRYVRRRCCRINISSLSSWSSSEPDRVAFRRRWIVVDATPWPLYCHIGRAPLDPINR